MRQSINNFYVWKYLLILTFATVGCYAQTTKIEPANTSQKKSANQTLPEEKQQSTVQCDFSQFNTLKEMPGAISALPKPPRPKKARKIFGDVKVRVLLNREGRVEQACRLEGNEVLAESAVKAAMQIRVSPEYVKKRLDMKKMDYMEFTITYNFRR